MRFIRRVSRARQVVIVAIVSMSPIIGSCTGAGGHPASNGASSQPPTTPPSGSIIFDRAIPGVHGASALFAVDPSGQDLRVIRSRSCCAVLSADGSRFLDTSTLGTSDRITASTYRSDGSGLRTLPIAGADLELPGNAISPDGTEAASEGIDDSRSGLEGVYTRSTSGGGRLVRLTDAGVYHDVPLSYSPDGSKILFVRNAQPGDDDNGAMDLFVVNTDGSGLTQLNPRGTTSGYIQLPVVATASWSPDSAEVAFVAADGSFPDAATRSVYVVNADGSNPREIISGQTAWSATWSPDGGWIAVGIFDGSTNEIFVVRPDGSGLTEVSRAVDADYSFGPRWSPDGAWLVFIAGRGEGFDGADLWVASVDGQHALQVTHHPDSYSSYAWSPDTG